MLHCADHGEPGERSDQRSARDTPPWSRTLLSPDQRLLQRMRPQPGRSTSSRWVQGGRAALLGRSYAGAPDANATDLAAGYVVTRSRPRAHPDPEALNH